MKSDYLLCIPIDSDVPRVLVYMHEYGHYTSGGGDTQKVRLWVTIPNVPVVAGGKGAG